MPNSTTSHGRFGIHGGQYIPETLMNAILELEEAYDRCREDPEFITELDRLEREYAGRPSLLYYAERVTRDLGGAKVYLKREDLNHTGAHKINNALGQALLAKRMGKTRLIAETGAGQHGVATATVAAYMGMECRVYMGVKDMERQALNVYRMRLMGAEVIGVESGTGTLKDAVSETFREWTNRIDDTHYCLGSCMGPHPFPTIVRDFQAVISKEIRAQILEREGRLPDAVIACVGGGSNAIGSFYNFIDDLDVRLIGCEAAGRGVDTWETAATVNTGRVGIFHARRERRAGRRGQASCRCVGRRTRWRHRRSMPRTPRNRRHHRGRSGEPQRTPPLWSHGCPRRCLAAGHSRSARVWVPMRAATRAPYQT